MSLRGTDRQTHTHTYTEPSLTSPLFEMILEITKLVKLEQLTRLELLGFYDARTTGVIQSAILFCNAS